VLGIAVVNTVKLLDAVLAREQGALCCQHCVVGLWLKHCVGGILWEHGVTQRLARVWEQKTYSTAKAALKARPTPPLRPQKMARFHFYRIKPDANGDIREIVSAAHTSLKRRDILAYHLLQQRYEDHRLMKTFFSMPVILACLATSAFAQSFPEIVREINGYTPPGDLKPLQNEVTMIDTIDANGNRLVVMQGVREAGTRVGIHVHEYGGHTCVVSGTITDFVEGKPPMLFKAGQCYYMPPNVPMTATNLGSEDAVLIDTFILPPGEPLITILEPGYPGGPSE